MKIKIDFRSHIPINTQILAQIKGMIASGELRAGQRLPTLRGLADELQVNFTTVARAYRTLDAEGLVSTQHGRGTFVLGPSTELKNLRLREQSLDELARTFVLESRRLGFDDQAVLQAVQLRLAGSLIYPGRQQIQD
ncbi:MAG: GntR family transcriptional regulator [Anaerolineales bacterium]|jgi:GntR family transcriptional regulator